MRQAALRVLANLALLAGSLLVVVVLAEVALRFTPYANLLPQRILDSFRPHLRSDPVIGYDLQKDSPSRPAYIDGRRYDIWTNGLGCFDRPYAGESDPVLLIGDSFTFAFAPFEDKWGTRMEELLRRRVLKCGVGGYGTRHATLKAAAVLPLLRHPPKLIVVGYFPNDLEDDYLFPLSTVVDGYPVRTRSIKSMDTGEIAVIEASGPGKQQAFRIREYPKSLLLKKAKQWLEGHSILYLLTRSSVKSLILKLPFARNAALNARLVMPPTLAFSSRPWVDAAWEGHFANLRALKELADGCGAALLVVIIPYKEQVYPFLSGGIPPDDPARPQRLVGDFLRKEGIPTLDALPLLKAYANQERHAIQPDRDLYWRMDPHLSVPGNRLLGLLVSRHILESGLLEVPDRDARLAAVTSGLAALAARP